ncbi:centrosomal protein kizuna isoform X2 [Erpetoichthys calabaricus]|uniref:centrosomal protein kizuna isoform X2 n=1 Tax=Erpetoichthys calabaricus TaxID=27687 RepID=UPI0022341605|nr:centrosomal protein kizuna isoform X2 [Erpetoichthys calabaricus]
MFTEKDYFAKVGQLQQLLCESFQMKRNRLQAYLKEVHNREKHATVRNQTFLNEANKIEAHLQMMASSIENLHQNKVKQFPGASATDVTTDFTEGLYQPAVIFMGRQTSTLSDPPIKLPTEHFTRHISLLHEQEKVDSCNTSTVVSKTKNIMPLSSNVYNVEVNSIDSSSLGPATNIKSFRSETNNVSTKPTVVVEEESGSPEHGDDLLSPEQHPTFHSENYIINNNISVEKKQMQSQSTESEIPNTFQSVPVSSNHSKSDLGKDHKSSPKIHSKPEIPEQQKDEDSESDLTVSVSEDDDEDYYQDETVVRNVTIVKSDLSKNNNFYTMEDSMTQEWKPTSNVENENGISSLHKGLCLSMESFLYLLASIEGRIISPEQQHTELYRLSTISNTQLTKIISLCNQKESLNEENLEACGAVVLHQLQKLSQDTLKGSLLNEEILTNNWTCMDENRVRSSMPSDSAELWDIWYRHAVVLEVHSVLTGHEIAEIFAPLITPSNSTNINEAKELLKMLFLEVGERSLSVASSESSCSLPSVLNDSGEIKQAKPAQWLYSTVIGKQGQQNDYEESKEELFIENIPIRETKAYQMLKQSAVQQTQDSQDEVDMSEIEHGEKCGEIHSEKGVAVCYQSLQEGNKPVKQVPTLKSKAFWGESDDSSSDIEAALRPQTLSTYNDDFDDFYD